MAIQLSKTVFIGLGGTGAKTLLRAKSAMIENYGEVPPMIKFLAIDTDERQKIAYSNVEGKEFNLDTNEFIQLKVEDVPSFIKKNSRACSFFPKGLIEKKSSITQGAGQFRACGRLALLTNYSHDFQTSLKNAIDTVRNWKASVNDKYEVDGTAETRVFVVFSIAGGTGAGCFIDLPLMLKSNGILKPKENLTAIALLPDVYSNKGFSTVNCNPNAVVGMTEYEFLADNKLEEMESDADAPSRKIVTPNGITYSVDKNFLYDSFFLVNNRSTMGVQYQTDDEMADFIAKALYLAAGFTGGSTNSSLDNIKAQGHVPVKGKVCRYLGLGCAEIQIQPKQIADYYSLSYMQRLCSKIQMSSSASDIATEVQNKISEWQIEEDNGNNFSIDALAPARPAIGFANLSEFGEGANQTIKAKKGTWITTVKNNLSAHIYGISGSEGDGTLNLLKGIKLNAFHEYIIGKLNGEGGLSYTKLFLTMMKGRLQGMISEMENEINDLNGNVKKLELAYKEQLDNIILEENKFRLIPGRKSKKIEEACEEYVILVNREANYIHEIDRRTAAIVFLIAFQEKVSSFKTSITQFEEQLSIVSERVARESSLIKNRSHAEPFTIHIDSDAIDKINLKDSEIDFKGFHSNNKISDLVFLGQTADELYIKIKNFTDNLQQTVSYRTKSILDVFETLTEERTEEIIDKLSKSIGVLRTLDHSEAINTTKSFVIGVFNAKHNAIIKRSTKPGSPSLKKNLGDVLRSKLVFNQNEPQLSNTQDPNKIIVNCYESLAPAFIVDNFINYNHELKDSGTETSLRFSNKYWGDLISFREFSIFPHETEDSIIAWTLAFIVSKVELDKGNKVFIKKEKNGNYFVSSEKAGASAKNMLDLRTPYREKAFEIFNDKQISSELWPKIKAKIKNNLEFYDKLISSLKEDSELYICQYSDHKLDSALTSKSYKGTRDQIDKEYDALLSIGSVHDVIF